MPSFLRSGAVQVLTAFLLLQAGLMAVLAQRQPRMTEAHLDSLPVSLGAWSMVAEYPVEEEVQKVLRATSTLNRMYAKRDAPQVNVFIAFFGSQKSGAGPHSPKNCLPGSGWAPTSSSIEQVSLGPGRPEIEVNRYIVAKGDARSLVLYWYQTGDRIVASEYKAKAYLVLDSARYNRSDAALVRFVVNLPADDKGEAESAMQEFLQNAVGPIRQALPQ